MRAIQYSIGYIFPVLGVLGFYLGGYYNFLVIGAAFGVIPILDELLGSRPKSISEKEESTLRSQKTYRVVLYLFLPIVSAYVFWAVSVFSWYEFGAFELIGFTLSTALISGGMGITVAHELIHRSSRLERLVGESILLSTCYMYFTIEHVLGHHKKVATPNDPATAKFGESLYAYLPGAVSGQFLSAFRCERDRLKKYGLSAWSPRNRMIWYIALPAAYAGVLFWLFGPLALVFFFAQAFIGAMYLDVINYVEHYGLLRRVKEDGRYERVGRMHSWNSYHPVSNMLLLKLPTHSDHHTNASRRYQILKSVDGAPELPYGYGIMMPLAFFPPLWFKIMNPIALDARKRAGNPAYGKPKPVGSRRVSPRAVA